MADLAQSMRQGQGMSRSGSYNRLGSIQLHTRPKIGQILIEAGALTPANLHHAMKLAQESKQPTGRMLVSLNYISEELLQAALLAQSLIGQGIVSEGTALLALKTSVQNKVTFNSALAELDRLDPARRDDQSLGGLIMASGMVAEEAVQEARARSYESGVLIGQVLLITQTMTVAMLDDALTVAVLLRDGDVNREQAIAILKDVRRNRISVTSAIRLSRIKPNTKLEGIRLGELLSRSRLITEREAMLVIESALHSNRKLGEEIVSKGLVAEEVVSNALVLQHLINRGVISASQGIEIIRTCSLSNRTITDVTAQLRVFRETEKDASALMLCLEAGILHIEAVNKAVQDYQDLGLGQAKAALAGDFVSVQAFTAAVSLAEQFDARTVTYDQAKRALKHCNQTHSDVQVAIAAVGLGPEQPAVVKTVRKSPAQKVRETVSDWASYDELLPILLLGPIAVAVGYLLVKYMHATESTAIFFGLALISLGMVKFGRSWDKCSAARQEMKAVKMECAQVTKARLSRRTR